MATLTPVIILSTKTFFYKKSLCLIYQNRAGKAVVKQSSEEILGNILVDLERSGKIGNLMEQRKQPY